MEKAIIDALVVGGPALVTGWIGFYVGAYLKKKGENQAIHEDINKLVDQVRAVTQTTKEIEARISSDVWNQQKQWEMKREVLFEAAKRIVELDNGLISLDSLLRVSDPGAQKWTEARHDATQGWNDATKRFDEIRLLVAITCSKETSSALDSLYLFITQLGAKLVKKDVDVYPQSGKELAKGLMAARLAIRKELGIETVAVAGSVSAPSK